MPEIGVPIVVGNRANNYHHSIVMILINVIIQHKIK